MEYMTSSSRAGLPDLHMIWGPNGRSVWAELKVADADGERRPDARISGYGFTKLQVAYLNRVQRFGGIGLGLVGLFENRRWSLVVIAASDLGDGNLTWSQVLSRRRLAVSRSLASALQDEASAGQVVKGQG